MWPIHLDKKLNEYVLDLVCSVDEAGFKFPHNPAQPGIYAGIYSRPFSIIHILREDLLEQYASWMYLNHFGISKATPDGCEGTDGKTRKVPEKASMRVEPSKVRRYFDFHTKSRWLVWQMYRESHPYMEIHMDAIFDYRCKEVFDFLGTGYDESYRPNHIPTPRPKARDFFDNYSQLKSYFRNTEYGHLFE